MFRPPDRRAIILFAVFLPVALACILVPAILMPPGHPVNRAFEVVGYLSYVLFGTIMGVLELKQGFCLNRPGITRADSPLSFWIEVLISFGIAVIGFVALVSA
jgi:hypothetical protein